MTDAVIGGRYEIDMYLGGGTFGDVYRAWDRRTKQRVAVKCARICHVYGIEPETLIEISTLQRMHHPCIVKLLDVVLTDTHVMTVYELCAFDLSMYLKSLCAPVPLPKMKSIMRSLLSAVEECHKHAIVHRDIKPANVLVGKHGTGAKLADFGACTSWLFGPVHSKTGTVSYRAPECMWLDDVRDFGGAMDMWSAGMIMVEMMTGKTIPQWVTLCARSGPFQGESGHKCTRHAPAESFHDQTAGQIAQWNFYEQMLGPMHDHDIPVTCRAYAASVMLCALPCDRHSTGLVDGVEPPPPAVAPPSAKPESDECIQAWGIADLRQMCARHDMQHCAAKPVTGAACSDRQLCEDLLCRMLVYNPETRIAATDALAHPWFR